MRTFISLILICMAVSSCTYYICDCKHPQTKGNPIFDNRIVYPEYQKFYPDRHTLELRCDTIKSPDWTTVPGRIGIGRKGDTTRLLIIGNADCSIWKPAPNQKLSIKGFKNDIDTLK